TASIFTPRAAASASPMPAPSSPTAQTPCASRRPATARCTTSRKRTCAPICCARPGIAPIARSRARPRTGPSRSIPRRRKTRSGPTRHRMTRCSGSPGTSPFTAPASIRSKPPDMALIQNWRVAKPGVAARGTAVDAVVAAAFALSVREPWNSGLGGIGFMVVHPAGAAKAEVVDFGPVAPLGLDPAQFPLTGEVATDLFAWPRVAGDRNVHGPLSFAVPAAVRGYAAAVERFGRMKWRDLVAPAVELAKEGLPVDWY